MSNNNIFNKTIDKSTYINAQKTFDKFLKNNYDITNPKVEHKIKHTYNVVNNAKYISESLNLSDEDIYLSMIIALLHDIGRFEQAIKMKTFREDITNYDHATLGVKLLFEENEIRNYIETNAYDEIIKKAIGNHSKYILPEDDMNEKELLHAKIIRDADKIDSYRAKTVDDITTMANISISDIENSKITDTVYNDFMCEKTILSKDRKTGIDIWVSYIAMVFGLYFDCSLKVIYENDYINKLFDRFDYKYDKEKMETLRNNALRYLDNRLE